MRGYLTTFCIICAMFAAQAAEDSRPAEPTTASLTGLSGAMRVPDADLLPFTHVRATWNALPDEQSPSVGGTDSYVFSLPIVPHTEMALAVGDQKFGSDLTINAKWQLRAPQLTHPGWAVGVLDFKRTGRYDAPTAFAVATQPFADGRGVVTAGLAAGQNAGPLASAQWALTPWLALQTEYDSTRVNVGALARIGTHWQLHLANLDVGTILSTTFEWGLPSAKSVPEVPGMDTLRGQPVSQALESVQTAMVAEGFEDVQVWQDTARRVGVAYENRRYTRSELDGVLTVLTILAHTAPSDTPAYIVRPLKRRIPMVEVTSDGAATRAYSTGMLPVDSLAQGWHVLTLPGAVAPMLLTLPRVNPAAGHTDLAIGVKTTASIATEDGTLLGVYAAPHALVPLGRGLAADGLWAIPVGGPLVHKEPQVITERALVAYAFHPAPRSLAQISVGQFSREDKGVALEVVRPVGANQLYRVIGAWVDTDIAGNKAYALADYGCWLPRYQMYLRILGGQFIHDSGVGGDITRFFGDVQVRAGLRFATNESLAELQFTLPLSPSRQAQRPTGLRIRPEDYWTFRTRSVLEGANYLSLTRRTAVELPLGPSISDTMLDFNRLLPGPMEHAWTPSTP